MYRVSNTVRTIHNQDGAIVLDVRQGQMFNVNFVGSRILELLKCGSTESAIVDEIGREFGVRRELAEKDVREFLQSLKKCQLVEERKPALRSEHWRIAGKHRAGMQGAPAKHKQRRTNDSTDLLLRGPVRSTTCPATLSGRPVCYYRRGCRR